MEDPKFSQPVLEYALDCWNNSRIGAFQEAIDSLQAYYLGCSDASRIEDMEDLIDGFRQIRDAGLYGKTSGELANPGLPYRKNWYK